MKCNVDFEHHPELVLSADHALKPALAEWNEGQLNTAADRNDILAITRKINGGTNGLQDRKNWLNRIYPYAKLLNLAVPSQGPAGVKGPAPARPGFWKRLFG